MEARKRKTVRSTYVPVTDRKYRSITKKVLDKCPKRGDMYVPASMAEEFKGMCFRSRERYMKELKEEQRFTFQDAVQAVSLCVPEINVRVGFVMQCVREYYAQ